MATFGGQSAAIFWSGTDHGVDACGVSIGTIVPIQCGAKFLCRTTRHATAGMDNCWLVLK